MRIVGKILAGLLFSAIGYVAFSPFGAALSMGGSTLGLWLTLGLSCAILIACILARTVRRAFGRGFVLSGIGFLLMPLTGAMLSGRAFAEVMAEGSASGADRAAEAVGAGLGATALTGMLSIVGLVVGAVFVILGLVLLLGGRREVIVVGQS